MLPTIKALSEYHLLGKYVTGKTIAGCEKVNGI
jgi:hypothetical protein